MRKLVIVESPNKIKSLEKYLGNKYIVKSSVGHIVKLPSSGPHGFGVDLDTWTPNYKIDSSKKEVVKELKSVLKNVNDVYIATDPDREGEAIGDNIVTFLDIKNYKRIKFNEITKEAVLNAIAHPTILDEKLVNSQIARRILDRIIGYKLSKIMQKKVKNSPKYASAGRVQSIALKLVMKREKQIEDFIPVKYKKIDALIDSKIKNFKIPLYLENNEFDDNTWISINEFKKIKSKISHKPFKSLLLNEIKIIKRKGRQVIPLKQSTLYKRGNSKLGMSASSIQNVAQRLYEGYGEKGGLISYPRTDSTRFSNTFLKLGKKYILKNYGKEYLLKNVKGTSGDQDAHEAIRPTSLELTPKKVKKEFNLSSNEFKIYKLIWEHTMKSLMKVPIKEHIRYEFLNNKLTFKSSYLRVIFDGYYKITGYDEEKVPQFEKGQKLKVKDYLIEDKQTLPPSRYNDGSLIEKLDEIKVGRPSTFAKIVSILKERFYVDLEQKAMKITSFGKIIYEKLINGFPKFMDEKYTAKIEEELNEIAHGKKDYKKMLTLFWKNFEKLFDEQLEKTQVTIIPLTKSDKKCPKCDSNLVLRTNKKNGSEFLACPKFPECKYIDVELIQSDKKCPKCDSNLVLKTNKRNGNKFLACPKFPECKHAEPDPDSSPKSKRFFKKTNKK